MCEFVPIIDHALLDRYEDLARSSKVENSLLFYFMGILIYPHFEPSVLHFNLTLQSNVIKNHLI